MDLATWNSLTLTRSFDGVVKAAAPGVSSGDSAQRSWARDSSLRRYMCRRDHILGGNET